jgi:hypothetical protein
MGAHQFKSVWRENAVVHYSKIDCRMSLWGQQRR